MGVKVRKYKGSWYVFIDYHGLRKARKVGSREAANRVRREIEARLALGQFDLCSNETPSLIFTSYATKWLKEQAQVKCKASTVGFYRQCLRLYVTPHFGDCPLDKINREKVKDFVGFLCDRGLAKNTVRLALTTLRVVLNAAMEDNLISTNPATGIGRFIKSEKPRQEATALTAEEVDRLLEVAKEYCPRHYPLLLTATRAGLRRGELIALRWGDIQFGSSESDPNRYILVQRNLNQRWSRKFSTPKSKKPRRVDLSRELRRVLIELRDQRLLVAFAAGRDSIADDLVFPSQKGTVLNIRNFVERVFLPLLERAGLRKIRFHDMRHTFGSLLIQKGASLVYVKEQMGHISIQVTVDTYGHLVPAGNIDWVDRLDETTSPQKSATQTQPKRDEAEKEIEEVLQNEWLGGRDSNPDTQIQSLQSYR